MREFSASTVLAVVLCLGLAARAQASDAEATCRQLNLSPTAQGDCAQQLGAALTNKDRAKVIHTFAVGSANTKADALISQLSASPSTPAPGTKASTSTKPAPVARKTSNTEATAPNNTLAIPQQKATTAGGGPRTGTKAGPQHTESADQPAAKAKPKAEKTSHQPADKGVKKSGH
jgi:hypothetical protein